VQPQGKRALFVINRHSGMGQFFAVEDRIHGVCKKNNTECIIEQTKYRAHAVTLARDAAADTYDYVVAVGGDGTINEVAQGLVGTGTAMGILPRGSGNGLARHLGIPAHLPDAIDTLFDNAIVRMDTLLINNRLSLNVSGIGFDGHIANLFADEKIRGLLGYARLAIVEMLKFKEFDSELTIDGKTISAKVFIVAFANSSQYGNNFRIAPYASVSDGLFDLTLIKKVSLRDLGFIYSFWKGNLKKSELCDMLVAKEVTVKTSYAVPYHIDGEPCGVADTFTIVLQPSSLSVLVPKSNLIGRKI
jgi:YegS/Rv2252/BmrU family lipid kinase